MGPKIPVKTAWADPHTQSFGYSPQLLGCVPLFHGLFDLDKMGCFAAQTVGRIGGKNFLSIFIRLALGAWRLGCTGRFLCCGHRPAGSAQILAADFNPLTLAAQITAMPLMALSLPKRVYQVRVLFAKYPDTLIAKNIRFCDEIQWIANPCTPVRFRYSPPFPSRSETWPSKSKV